MTLDEIGIRPIKAGVYSTVCPNCSDTRKAEHRKTPCLTVWNTENNQGWNCSHCGFRGNLATYEKYDKVRENARMPKVRPSIFSKQVNDFLASKQITPETAYKCGCYEVDGRNGKELAFPYWYRRNLVNVMFRKMVYDKSKGEGKVYQLKKDYGTKSCFWGLEMLDLEECKEVIIVEGQTDRMTHVQLGYKNVLSVPMGAANPGQGDMEKKFEYLTDPYIVELFEKVEKFWLFMDNDTAGVFTRKLLAEKLGKERCYIPWCPDKYKDSNEVYAGDAGKGLDPMGKDGVAKMYELARPFPMKGVISVSDAREELEQLAVNGFKKGLLCGLDPIDKLFTLMAKYLMVWTGVPGSGKSAVWRYLITEYLKKNPNLELAGYTPESRPMSREYAKIAEIVGGGRFEPKWHNSMSEEKRNSSLDYVEKHITLVNPDVHNFETFGRKETGSQYNPKGLRSILQYMLYLKKTKGIYGFWIDAWNKLDHQRGSKPIEEFISQELDFLLEFLDKHDLFCLVMAHPTKMERVRGGNYKRPSLYDIKGSSAWNEKADVGVVIHRNIYKKTNRRDENDEEVWEINKNAPTDMVCEKLKFDELGELGETKMWIDRQNGDRFQFDDPNRETYETKKEKKRKTIPITSSVEENSEDDDDKPLLATDDLPF